jgi:hypothetical protein
VDTLTPLAPGLTGKDWAEPLPPGAELLAVLNPAKANHIFVDVYRPWIAEHGLDAERYISLGGISVWATTEDKLLLAVDYLHLGEVKGHENAIMLNFEAGRVAERADRALEPALDRAVVDLSVDAPLPALWDVQAEVAERHGVAGAWLPAPAEDDAPEE